MFERQRTTIALVKGMVILLLECILALFLYGFQVRNCNSANQQNSDDALQAAHYTFHILVHLCRGAEHTTECVWTLRVSFLFWGRWEQHRMLRTGACLSALPGTCPPIFYLLIVSAAGNIPPKNASDIFPSLGISEAMLPKFVGVIASDIASDASDDRSEFTQAHTRSIASKMLWHIAWNWQELCILNCLLNPKEIARVFVKKSPSDQSYTLTISPHRTWFHCLTGGLMLLAHGALRR